MWPATRAALQIPSCRKTPGCTSCSARHVTRAALWPASKQASRPSPARERNSAPKPTNDTASFHANPTFNTQCCPILLLLLFNSLVYLQSWTFGVNCESFHFCIAIQKNTIWYRHMRMQSWSQPVLWYMSADCFLFCLFFGWEMQGIYCVCTVKADFAFLFCKYGFVEHCGVTVLDIKILVVIHAAFVYLVQIHMNHISASMKHFICWVMTVDIWSKHSKSSTTKFRILADWL